MDRRRVVSARAPARGFTLLEVLLAFIVFALSFAVILEIVGGSVRSTVRARDYSEAALLAQSLIDMVGTEIPLETGSLAGDSEGGYLWTLEISPYQPVDGDEYVMDIAAMNGTLLFWVDLHMQWGEAPREREAHFTTVRSILEGINQ